MHTHMKMNTQKPHNKRSTNNVLAMMQNRRKAREATKSAKNENTSHIQPGNPETMSQPIQPVSRPPFTDLSQKDTPNQVSVHTVTPNSATTSANLDTSLSISSLPESAASTSVRTTSPEPTPSDTQPLTPESSRSESDSDSSPEPSLSSSRTSHKRLPSEPSESNNESLPGSYDHFLSFLTSEDMTEQDFNNVYRSNYGQAQQLIGQYQSQQEDCDVEAFKKRLIDTIMTIIECSDSSSTDSSSDTESQLDGSAAPSDSENAPVDESPSTPEIKPIQQLLLKQTDAIAMHTALNAIVNLTDDDLALFNTLMTNQSPATTKAIKTISDVQTTLKMMNLGKGTDSFKTLPDVITHYIFPSESQVDQLKRAQNLRQLSDALRYISSLDLNALSTALNYNNHSDHDTITVSTLLTNLGSDKSVISARPAYQLKTIFLPFINVLIDRQLMTGPFIRQKNSNSTDHEYIVFDQSDNIPSDSKPLDIEPPSPLTSALYDRHLAAFNKGELKSEPQQVSYNCNKSLIATMSLALGYTTPRNQTDYATLLETVNNDSVRTPIHFNELKETAAQSMTTLIKECEIALKKSNQKTKPLSSPPSDNSISDSIQQQLTTPESKVHFSKQIKALITLKETIATTIPETYLSLHDTYTTIPDHHSSLNPLFLDSYIRELPLFNDVLNLVNYDPMSSVRVTDLMALKTALENVINSPATSEETPSNPSSSDSSRLRNSCTDWVTPKEHSDSLDTITSNWFTPDEGSILTASDIERTYKESIHANRRGSRSSLSTCDVDNTDTSSNYKSDRTSRHYDRRRKKQFSSIHRHGSFNSDTPSQLTDPCSVQSPSMPNVDSISDPVSRNTADTPETSLSKQSLLNNTSDQDASNHNIDSSIKLESKTTSDSDTEINTPELLELIPLTISQPPVDYKQMKRDHCKRKQTLINKLEHTIYIKLNKTNAKETLLEAWTLYKKLNETRLLNGSMEDIIPLSDQDNLVDRFFKARILVAEAKFNSETTSDKQSKLIQAKHELTNMKQEVLTNKYSHHNQTNIMPGVNELDQHIDKQLTRLTTLQATPIVVSDHTNTTRSLNRQDNSIPVETAQTLIDTYLTFREQQHLEKTKENKKRLRNQKIDARKTAIEQSKNEFFDYTSYKRIETKRPKTKPSFFNKLTKKTAQTLIDTYLTLREEQHLAKTKKTKKDFRNQKRDARKKAIQQSKKEFFDYTSYKRTQTKRPKTKPSFFKKLTKLFKSN